MKTIFCFSMDENGKVEITTDNEQLLDRFASPTNHKLTKQFLKELMTAVVHKMWGEKNTCLSKAVRLLSMAEVCSCAEPYQQAEDFWSTMMFGFIKDSEKMINPLKEMYGFNPRIVERPIVGGDTFCFRIGKPEEYPWRGKK